MVQTLQLSTIVRKLCNTLRNDQALNDFCKEKYGKPLTILVAMNTKQLPAKMDCPFVVISPGRKSEGTGDTEHQYTIPVAWCVYNKASTTENGITEYLGVYETDDMGQLIYEALVELNPNNPIKHIDYTVGGMTSFPQFSGHMEATIVIPIVMGGTINY
jgi:hypothetical protein